MANNIQPAVGGEPAKEMSVGSSEVGWVLVGRESDPSACH